MKAILVIDMPMDCGACMLGVCDDDDFESTHIRCYAHRYTVGEDSADMFSKPSWCPLKPLPSKRLLIVPNDKECEVKLNMLWNDGWNACIEEIEQ